MALKEPVGHGARLVQIQIYADAETLRPANQVVERPQPPFPARAQLRREGKFYQLIQHALKPHALHAHARVALKQPVGEWIQLGREQRVAVEGEIGASCIIQSERAR